MNAKVFILPGLNNSGATHWQSQWEKAYGFTRINQDDWDTPSCADWLERIDQHLSRLADKEILLVGHSLACCTIAHWANASRRFIKGALLVGPSDVEAPSYPKGTTGFSPMPLQEIQFPTVVLASTNDEYVSVERAQYFADQWKSKLVWVGEKGHINSASNLGRWQEGYEWLLKLDLERIGHP
ncbi:MAG: RBBP9/YdeN family alpha/beta hydrolase [Chitinophagales bacterium]